MLRRAAHRGDNLARQLPELPRSPEHLVLSDPRPDKVGKVLIFFIEKEMYSLYSNFALCRM